MFLMPEERDILNANNDVDLFCLHKVFIQNINNSLDKFVQRWNNHPLTLEQNRSRLQVFSLTNDFDSSDNDDGSSQQHFSFSGGRPQQEVPNLTFTPCVLLQTQVKILVLQLSADQGIDVYERVAHTVDQHVTEGCNACIFT